MVSRARGSGVLRGALALLGCLLAVVAGIGWLYVLRGAGWPSLGPRLRDALPLMQLAGTDGQPLSRMLLAWLPAGAAAGGALLVLLGLARSRRSLFAVVVGLGVILFASQASYALARNVPLNSVLWSRSPGPGAWLEAGLFALGAAAPGRIRPR